MAGDVPRFTLCEACLADYLALRWNDEAHKVLNTLPLQTIHWSDEHPASDGQRPWLCDAGCRDSICRLVAARGHYWAEETIPPGLEQVWEDARALIPDWPGFGRLYPTPEDRREIKGWERRAAAELAAFLSMFDQVEVKQGGDGMSSYSASASADTFFSLPDEEFKRRFEQRVEELLSEDESEEQPEQA